MNSLKKCFNGIFNSSIIIFCLVALVLSSCSRSIESPKKLSDSEIDKLEKKYAYLSLKMDRLVPTNVNSKGKRFNDLDEFEKYLSSISKKWDTVSLKDLKFTLTPVKVPSSFLRTINDDGIATHTYLFNAVGFSHNLNITVTAHITYNSNARTATNTITAVTNINSTAPTAYWTVGGPGFNLHYQSQWQELGGTANISGGGSVLYLDHAGTIDEIEEMHFMGFTWEVGRTTHSVGIANIVTAVSLPFYID